MGRLPTETGGRDNFSPAVGSEGPLLAEVLKASGFLSKSAGRQKVALPEGYLNDLADVTPPGIEAEAADSGG